MTLLYGELAAWWPLLSAPAEYEEEASAYLDMLLDGRERPAGSLLELGCGGGNNASHMKGAFSDVTLTDVSPGMLAVSRALNPDCTHVEGDMRTLRLGRTFDFVFVHDAIDYMRNEDELRAAFETARIHLEPDGVALFAPDHLLETFTPSTSHGGHDDGDRGLRYLEWTRRSGDGTPTTVTDYAYLLREGDAVRAASDRHLGGLFPHQTWLDLLAEAGFRAESLRFRHSEVDQPLDVFRGIA